MPDAVRLKFATRGRTAGAAGDVTSFAVRVRNAAYLKDVAVHYTADGYAWKDFPLAFASHHGDHDEFAGTLPEAVSRFVVRYYAAGSTWFDNNGGANYRFDTFEVAVGGNVALHRAAVRHGAGGTSWLEGEILLVTLSPDKEAGARVTADDWATWHDTNGTWAGDTTADGLALGPGAEVWRFRAPEANPNAVFRFAVYHRNLTTGEVYWDTNFGQNYSLDRAAGATVG